MSAPNVIELRRLLENKFPGLRTRADELGTRSRDYWPTGLRQIDETLRGGLPRGALTEVVAAQCGRGGAFFLSRLLHQAAHEKQMIALIDGSDSFEVTQVEESDLSRLLWVRCRTAEEALKATDLLLRDGNLPLVLLDLAANPSAQLRKISATTWYRLQRIVEQTSTVSVIVTPRPMVSPAQARVTLQSRFLLADLERDTEELQANLMLEISETRRTAKDDADWLRRSAG
jgi:hypothetical protein